MKDRFDLLLGIYVLLVAVLGGGVAMMAFDPESDATWLVLVVPILALLIGMAQAILLLTRAGAAPRRRIPQLPIWVPAIAAGLLLAFLLLLCVGLVCQLVYGDRRDPPWIHYVLLAPLAGWIVWTVLFWRIGRRDGVDRLVDRAMRWLLAGSLLELVVAVVTHVVVRRRGDCCGDALTAASIILGLAISALCFGPALVVLIVQRVRRKSGAVDSGPSPRGRTQP